MNNDEKMKMKIQKQGKGKVSQEILLHLRIGTTFLMSIIRNVLGNE